MHTLSLIVVRLFSHFSRGLTGVKLLDDTGLTLSEDANAKSCLTTYYNNSEHVFNNTGTF